MTRRLILTVCLCTAAVLGSQRDEDEVKKLPNLEFKLNFKHFSGYLNVAKTRRLHYWFVQSQRDPAKDPLILWLNGGPGCSSLEGLLTENGPFLVPEGYNGTGKLLKNDNSWNKFANVLYLETPAGAGFSVNDVGAFAYNDNTTAADNHNALVKFFELFPEYRKRELYLTGESYAGCYIPTLATHILDNQNKYNINLKGVALANAVTTGYLRTISREPFLFFHGLSSMEAFEKWQRTKCPTGLDNYCLKKNDTLSNVRVEDAMDSLGLTVEEQDYVPVLRNLELSDKGVTINPYDIFRPCDGCLPIPNSTYLNQGSVQDAIHVRRGPFATCNYDITKRYEKCKDMTPHVERILEGGVKLFYFYGDTGGLFARSVGQKVVKESKPWFVDKKWAGTRVQYARNLTFTTIAGVGHMSPGWSPKATARAMDFFIRDIDLVTSA